MNTSVLSSLADVEGVTGYTIFDAEGACVDHRMPKPYELVLVSKVYEEMRSALDPIRYVDEGSVRSFVARFENGNLVMRSFSNHTVLVLTEHDVNMATVNVAFNVAAMKLQSDSMAKLEAAPKVESTSKLEAAPKVESTSKLDAAPKVESESKLEVAAKIESESKLEAAAKVESESKLEAAPPFLSASKVEANPSVATKFDSASRLEAANSDSLLKIEAAARIEPVARPAMPGAPAESVAKMIAATRTESSSRLAAVRLPPPPATGQASDSTPTANASAPAAITSSAEPNASTTPLPSSRSPSIEPEPMSQPGSRISGLGFSVSPMAPDAIPPDAVGMDAMNSLWKALAVHVGPAAKFVLKQQLKAMSLNAQAVNPTQFRDLIAALASSIPDAAGRDQFTLIARAIPLR